MERNYIAFISYRHAPLDSAVAKALHGFIEQFNIPRSLRRGGEKSFGYVFRDQEELPASSDLSEHICRALDSSEYLIVICSRATVQSPWVSREIEYFLSRHDRKKVLAVLAEGEPAEVFPAALTQILQPDGSIVTVEPLAVDARAESTAATVRRLRREALRLYAAMLGCPYDSLVQRQQRRRRRRIGAAMALVLAVALIFSGVLLVKNMQIDRKNQELELKNNELTEQKAQILLRESELLTQTAEDALAEGRCGAAISSAISALTQESGEDRPYYAGAENVLMDALNIFGTKDTDHLIIETELTQLSTISDYAISPDGKSLVTIDAFGNLISFDTARGTELWTASIPVTHTAAAYDHQWPLITSEDKNCFFAFCGGTLAAFSFENGEMIWALRSLTPENDHIRLSPDGGSLVCLVRELIPESGMLQHKLMLIDLDTGSITQEIPVGEEHGISYYLSNAQHGAFSPDGRFYAGSWYTLEDEIYTLSYYIADLDRGSVRFFRSEEIEGFPYNSTLEELRFSEDGSYLLALRLSPEGAINVCMECIDTESGEILWRCTPDAEGQILHNDSDALLSLHLGKNTYLARGNALFCIDCSSGEQSWSYLFPEKLSHISIVDDRFFNFVLESGFCALAWRNDSGLFTSDSWGASADFGPVSSVHFWQDGFIRAELNGDSIIAINVSGADTRGFAAVMPAGNDRSLMILRSRSLDGLIQNSSADISGCGEIGSPLFSTRNGLVALGTFAQNGGEKLSVNIFSAENLSLEYALSIRSGVEAEKLLLLPDFSAAIYDGGHGDISLFNADGSEATLSENRTLTLSASGYTSFVASEYLSRSAAMESDGSVLSVRCSGDELRIWENGVFRESVPLPEGMIWSLSDNTVLHRILELGENGLAVLGRFDGSNDLTVDGFEVCDLHSGTWTALDDHGSGGAERIIIMGKCSPVFAVAEPDGSLWLYGLSAGKVEARRIDFALPIASAEQMELICGDSVLMLKTADGQLLFYELESGELLLRHTLPSRSSGKISVFEDVENHRLYAADTRHFRSSANGLCIDSSTWTPLAEIENMLHFDSESGRLWQYENGVLSAAVIPSTDELLAAGRSLIN